ncbi:MAG: hypothetical protein GY716_19635 [bacterium]|nr:hypothetical protein [bacterium]
MPVTECLSFSDAEKLVERHWEEYYERGVVLGFGVADRGGELKFIVKVKSSNVVDRLRSEYKNARVEGLPVHVEVQNLERLDASGYSPASLGAREVSLLDAIQSIVDRPGLLISGALLIATVAYAIVAALVD